jgi:hypothetical protein
MMKTYCSRIRTEEAERKIAEEKRIEALKRLSLALAG